MIKPGLRETHRSSPQHRLTSHTAPQGPPASQAISRLRIATRTKKGPSLSQTLSSSVPSSSMSLSRAPTFLSTHWTRVHKRTQLSAPCSGSPFMSTTSPNNRQGHTGCCGPPPWHPGHADSKKPLSVMSRAVSADRKSGLCHAGSSACCPYKPKQVALPFQVSISSPAP